MALDEDKLNIVHTLDPELLTNIPSVQPELKDKLHERPFYPITRFEGGRAKSPKVAVDINGFYDLVKEVVDFKNTQEGTVKKVLFTEDFPDRDEDLENEIITFGIKARLPGIIDQTSNPKMRNAKRQRKPLYRETLPDANNPGYNVIQEGLWFDNFIVFTCWARENKIANRRALWFEDMMREYEWVFRANGITHMRYEGRMADTEDIVLNRKVVGRPMEWLVRTERVVSRHEKKIEDLALKLDLIDALTPATPRKADI